MFLDEIPTAQDGLPPLEGTPRQMQYFAGVRDGKIKKCRKLVRDWQEYIGLLRAQRTVAATATADREAAALRQALDALEVLERETRVSWWIERRDNTARELLSGADARPGDGYGNEFEPG